MPEAVIVATARSPIGRAFKGSLTSIRPDDLTAQMITAALAKVPQLDPADIDDLILGCGLPGGEQGYNMARVVAVMLGYDSLPGTTVTRYCSSSLQTTRMAFHAIKAGEGDVLHLRRRRVREPVRQGQQRQLAGHQEPGVRRGRGAHRGAWPRAAPRSGTTRAPTARSPTSTSRWARPRRTSRRCAASPGQEQDEFGVRSQNLAEKAIADGFWQRDITPATLPDGTVVSADDGPRAGTTLEKVAALQPVFRPDGTVTAGNCCPLNDGAAAVIVMSDTQGGRARDHAAGPDRRRPGVTALSPEIMGLGPVEASRRALARAGHDDRRHRPGRDQRGVRRAGDPVLPGPRASTSTS